MLTVTPEARMHLVEVLAASEEPEQNNSVLRMYMSKDGLALALDLEKAEDTKHDHDGNTILVIDQQLSQALAGKTLDVENNEQGESLILH
jgi:Fe-S cluster assembly iron-binding protein IscA